MCILSRCFIAFRSVHPSTLELFAYEKCVLMFAVFAEFLISVPYLQSLLYILIHWEAVSPYLYSNFAEAHILRLPLCSLHQRSEPSDSVKDSNATLPWLLLPLLIRSVAEAFKSPVICAAFLVRESLYRKSNCILKPTWFVVCRT